jgi:hypothetical protein
LMFLYRMKMIRPLIGMPVRVWPFRRNLLNDPCPQSVARCEGPTLQGNGPFDLCWPVLCHHCPPSVHTV